MLFRSGNIISAKIGKKKVVGKISKIVKNSENDTVYVEIMTNSGRKFKVDSSRISPVDTATDNVPDNVASNISTSGIFAESRFLSFETFSSNL